MKPGKPNLFNVWIGQRERTPIVMPYNRKLCWYSTFKLEQCTFLLLSFIYIGEVLEFWVYPIFGKMTLVQRIIFISCNSLVALSGYFIGEALTSYIWGKLKLLLQFRKRPIVKFWRLLYKLIKITNSPFQTFRQKCENLW